MLGDDKKSYLKDKENISDDSGIIQTNINGYKSYEYSFIYFDPDYKKDFYCNVIWIKTNNNVYMINLEVVNDNLDRYKDIFNNIKNSFKEL